MLQILLPAENKIILVVCLKSYRSSIMLFCQINKFKQNDCCIQAWRKNFRANKILTSYKKLNISLFNNNSIISTRRTTPTCCQFLRSSFCTFACLACYHVYRAYTAVPVPGLENKESKFIEKNINNIFLVLHHCVTAEYCFFTGYSYSEGTYR